VPRPEHFFALVSSCTAALLLAYASPAAIAAERPIADGLQLLAEARAYEHGEGVAKDELRAARLYCDVARYGDAEAQFSLGWMYANGRGIARDDAVAASLFALAASRGHAQAAHTRSLITAEPGELPDCMRRPESVALATLHLEDIVTESDVLNLAPAKQQIAKVVAELAPRYAVDPRLALAVIAVESGFNASARSTRDARGLMQLVPDTMIRFKVRDGFDVKDNVRGGLAYLQFLLGYYRGHVRLVAAAYNAGERTVDRYRGVPPYAETADYVQRILRIFPQETHAYNRNVVKTSPIFEARVDAK
jgi:TPR repeat protein